MDLYLVSLATGAVGLGAMAIGGHVHAGHGDGHGDVGHIGHHAGHAGHGHAAHAGHAHAGHGGHSGDAGHGHGDGHGGGGFKWTSLLSPRLLFAVMVGFGAVGIAAGSLPEPMRFGVALAGAAAFEMLLVGPLWRFFFRFESKAALTLESAVEDQARAVTSFDVNGNGLVALEVDGQLVQLLAILAPDDRTSGVRVRRGDLVRVAEVDAARGRCTVTTLR